ncbi:MULTISPECIES: N-acetyltransferase [Hallella]|uniref:N-acetyltransferase n=1 Tax=Hallella faecis TaxID=2841596 RepID=A0ABV1FT33_9BACT|nr:MULTISPECIES: N-acetyltransferase [Hallella]MBP6273727.1 N-acetyltransferase [Prevotella sp.]MBS7399422.1 N-acetyltransferase [Prevotella sp.]MBU0290812.1 N-acetyltransferase [Hallella faecis]MCI7434137.1 N-acetyltransferase [Prevotella sp.]MDD7145510.1 N-acetyltransferase [Hallella sp.]
MAVEIRKVETKKDLKTFIDFHYDLYAGSPYDVPNLYIDERNTLDKKRNAAFDFCRAEYFLAYKDGKVAGRVAAIINNRVNKHWNRQDVRFGWIDFIDDLEVSRALFDAVAAYGRENGMTAMVGPLGFSDMDPEGMLTWGFDKLGTMATIYNYDYYPRHMEQMGGWAKDNDYVEYFLPVPDKVPEKYAKIASLVEKRYNLHVKKLTRKDVFQGGWGRKLFEIINATYTNLYGFVSLTDRQIDQYVKMYMPMVDLNLVTVIVDGNKNDAVAGMGITIPSLSHALQKCRRGRLLPTGWWHVLRAIKFHKTEGVDLLLVGFLPEYRAKGANALLFSDLIPRYVDYGIKWGETQVEMESNEGVQGQWGALNPINHKRRRCYRKEL